MSDETMQTSERVRYEHWLRGREASDELFAEFKKLHTVCQFDYHYFGISGGCCYCGIDSASWRGEGRRMSDERCNAMFANEGEGYFYCSKPKGHDGIHASVDGPLPLPRCVSCEEKGREHCLIHGGTKWTRDKTDDTITVCPRCYEPLEGENATITMLQREIARLRALLDAREKISDHDAMREAIRRTVVTRFAGDETAMNKLIDSLCDVAENGLQYEARVPRPVELKDKILEARSELLDGIESLPVFALQHRMTQVIGILTEAINLCGTPLAALKEGEG